MRNKLPPGPYGLPIVGYLPYLRKTGHKGITQLGTKYGNVFRLQLGVHEMVVLNDWQSVKSALYNDQCLGRPHTTPSTLMRKRGLADENGKVWREHSRFATQMFRDIGVGKGQMEDQIMEEIRYLIQYIDSTNGRAFNVHSVLNPSISNNICRILFGHRFKFNDPIRQLLDRQLDKMPLILSYYGLLATVPHWLSKIALKLGLHRMERIFDKTHDKYITYPDIFLNEILSHKKTFNPNYKRDYIDGYFEFMNNIKKSDPDSSFTDDELIGNCSTLLVAGSETTRTAVEWLLLFVANDCEHQKRIHEEIDSIIGRDRQPVWADRQNMPFTQAFINEVLRRKPPLPLNIMRSSLKDTTILGHSIPKDTKILINIYGVHHDPNVWQNPNRFNPNRFLSSDGKQVIRSEALISFSAGKRSCIGESLARMELFLYFTSLLQRYTIKAPEDTDLSFDETFGLILCPKYDPILSFEKRI